MIFADMFDFKGCQFCVKFCIDFGVALGANLGSSWRVLGRLGRLQFFLMLRKNIILGDLGVVQVEVDFGIRLGTVWGSFWDRFWDHFESVLRACWDRFCPKSCPK